MREYRNRICSAVLAAVCVIGTALIPSRAVHAEDVVDPIAVQKQAADVNENGNVDIEDLRKILRFVCGKIDQLNMEESGASK